MFLYHTDVKNTKKKPQGVVDSERAGYQILNDSPSSAPQTAWRQTECREMPALLLRSRPSAATALRLLKDGNRRYLLVAKKMLRVIGGLYRLHTGEVEFR